MEGKELYQATALPAIKPSDERELKLLAAKQMAENGYSIEATELYDQAEAMAPRKTPLDLQLALCWPVLECIPNRFRIISGNLLPNDLRLGRRRKPQ